MKFIFLMLSIMLVGNCGNLSKSNAENIEPIESFYHLNANDINGDSILMSNYKDKKILIVNVASKCGYTPQYRQLQELYDSYKDKLYILAFPSNDFLDQEPGSNQEIKAFCEVNFGIKFDIFEKISVTGGGIHPIYNWLSDESLNGWNKQVPTWNFTKYLIDENGVLVGVWGPKTDPLSDDILSKIIN